MRRLLLCLFCFGWVMQGWSQSDSTTKVASDATAQETQLKVMQSEQQLDSLKQRELVQSIQTLPDADSAKRGALNRELQQLQQKQLASQQQLKNKVDSLRKTVTGYPVVPFRDTLFYIYYRSGSIPAGERAQLIATRIDKLADDYFFSSDSLTVTREDETWDVKYKLFPIVSVSHMDALWAGMSGDSLAREFRNKIAAAVVQRKAETSWLTILKEIGWASLVLIGMALVVWFINRLFRKLFGFLHARKMQWFKGIRIRDYQLFAPEKELSMIISVLNLLKWILIIIAIYLALPLLFSIFPDTRDIATRLIAYVVSPVRRILLAVWNYLPNLFTILVIVILFRYVLKALKFGKMEVERGALVIPGFYADWANPTFQIVRVLVLAFMLVVIFPYLPGSDSPVFRGVSVFLGFLFTFGSAGSLSNAIAGIVLTYMRLFKIGDRVQVGEVTGDVIERSLLVTRIRTTKNEVISIPNSTVMSGHTVNYSSDALTAGLILHTTVTIGYDAPWRTVHELLINAALATTDILTQPAPFVLQTELNDFYVSYQINAYTRNPNRQAGIYSDLHQNIQDKFNEGGVEIMSPHYRAMRDGNMVTIPADYLPPEYVRPGFKVEQDDKKSE